LNSTKLNITDQRFNDTTAVGSVNTTVQGLLTSNTSTNALIAGVNSSGNLQSLGFNTTAQLNTLYYSSSNPVGFVNSSGLSIYNDTTAVGSVNTTVQGLLTSNTSMNSRVTNLETSNTTQATSIGQLNTSIQGLVTSNTSTNALIVGVNSSGNIISLGFNTTVQLNTLYYSSSNPVGFVNGSGLSIYNDTTAVGYINTTVQGLLTSNTSTNSRIDTLNSTKLNITDQRFNDTTALGSVNTTVQGLLTSNTSTNALIAGVNSSSNIISLGFNTTAQLNTLYLGVSDQRYNDTTLIAGKLDAIDQRYNDSASVNTLNSTKLNISDQRFNDTSLIAGVNSSGNLQSLGFNTTAQLNTLYLGISDQRYNDTTLISGKLDVTDQRYNETTSIGYLNTSISGLVTSNGTTNTRIDNVALNITGLVTSNASTNTRIDNVASNVTSLQASNTSTNARIDYLNKTDVSYTTANVSGIFRAIGDSIFDAGTMIYNATTNLLQGTFSISTSGNINTTGTINATDMYVNGNGVCTGTNGRCSDATKLTMTDIIDEKTYFKKYDFESMTAGYTTLWAPTPWAAAGTSALIAGNNTHPGMVSVSTSATASSGYCYQITGASTYLLDGGYVTELVFKPLTKTGNGTMGRFGFMDTFTAAESVDGVYFNMTQMPNNTSIEIIGIASNNSIRTATPTRYNLTNNTFYNLMVWLPSKTQANYYVFSESNALLWNDNITVTTQQYIPVATGRETSNAVCFWTSGATTAQLMANLDYISVGSNTSVNR